MAAAALLARRIRILVRAFHSCTFTKCKHSSTPPLRRKHLGRRDRCQPPDRRRVKQQGYAKACAASRWTSATSASKIVASIVYEERPLDSTHELDRFLTSIERRAFVTARIATGNAEDALDIVQDAMLGLAQRYAQRPAQEWGALFQTILQSRIRDWYRRARVRNRFRVWFGSNDEDAGDPVGELPDHAEPGPEGRIGHARAMGMLEQALNRLPLRQQQAFVLRAWEGLDTRATARAMSCSEGSVKTHYSRACEALRKVLKDYEP